MLGLLIVLGALALQLVIVWQVRTDRGTRFWRDVIFAKVERTPRAPRRLDEGRSRYELTVREMLFGRR